jgi:hypothetical protein
MTRAGSSRSGENNNPYDTSRRTSCMTLARSVGGSIAISSGLMLTSFRTTSCSQCSVSFSYTPNCGSPVGFPVWRLVPPEWFGLWFVVQGEHCNGLAPRFPPQARQRRMLDIQPDLRVVHPCRTLQVAGSRIVGFQCANSELVDEEGWLPRMVLAAHFAAGRMLLRFAA